MLPWRPISRYLRTCQSQIRWKRRGRQKSKTARRRTAFGYAKLVFARSIVKRRAFARRFCSNVISGPSPGINESDQLSQTPASSAPLGMLHLPQRLRSRSARCLSSSPRTACPTSSSVVGGVHADAAAHAESASLQLGVSAASSGWGVSLRFDGSLRSSGGSASVLDESAECLIPPRRRRASPARAAPWRS